MPKARYDEAGNKYCYVCQQFKPVNQFGKQAGTRDKLRPACRTCRKLEFRKPKPPKPLEQCTRLVNVKHEHGKKLCTHCRQWLDLTDYGKDGKGWDGLASRCLKCAYDRRIELSRARGVVPHDALKAPYNEAGDKFCRTCHAWKRPEAFYRDKYKWDGRHTVCAACTRALQRMRTQTSAVQRRQRAYWRRRKQTNTQVRIRHAVGTRILRALNGKRKHTRTLDLIGCSILEFKQHIERQFKPGMTWDNHGVNGWHIDHILPCSLFDLTDYAEQKHCFHYTNTQPLWADDNIRKGGTNRKELTCNTHVANIVASESQ